MKFRINTLGTKRPAFGGPAQSESGFPDQKSHFLWVLEVPFRGRSVVHRKIPGGHLHQCNILLGIVWDTRLCKTLPGTRYAGQNE
jgi:hypothetical protein